MAAGGGDGGSFSVKDASTLVIKGKFYDEYGTSKEYTNTLYLKIINENKIQINGDFYVPYIDALSYDIEIGNHEVADKLIKYGVDATGTEYESCWKGNIYWGVCL